jgi:hypothetical protein
MASLKELLAAKQSAAASAPKPAPVVAAPAAPGIVIRPSAPAPAAEAKPEPRPLGEPSAQAADVPFEFASEKPSEAARLWLAARQVPHSQLGIYLEPPPSCFAWLALDLPEDRGRLILLHRLPLLFKRTGDVPF